MADQDHLQASYADHHAANSRPKWLVDHQDAALAQLLATGLPTLADEDWRYTNLRPLRELALGPARTPRIDLSEYQLDAGCGVTIDGPLPAGVSVTQLRNVPADRIEAYFASAGAQRRDGMSLLNNAFAGDGLFIDISANTRVDQPLLINWLFALGDGELASPRLIVAAGEMSDVQIIENRVTAGGVCNGVTQITLAPGARLAHCDVKRDLAHSYNIGRIHARLERDASATFVSAALGGTLMRNDLDIELLAPGANATLHGVFMAAAGEHVDNHTCVDHIGAHTQSDEDYRGVVGKLGHGVFNGKVIVRPDAQKIASTQSNDNILLDDSAQIDTKPELQIYADDVRCAHGATVGRISENELFYLRARGIDERDARHMLLEAFVASALDSLEPQPLRDTVRALLGASLTNKLLEVPA